MEKLENTPSWQRGDNLKNVGTFRQNKHAPIHSWFSYTEGYSFQLVRDILFENKKAELIVDPFAGSFTTGVEAVSVGKSFHGYDINPVMKLIGEGKVLHAFKLARKIKNKQISEREIVNEIDYVISNEPIDQKLTNIFKGKDYYSRSNLKQLFNIRSNIEMIDDDDLQRVLLLALLSISVEVSNLKRSPDLKYKPENLWNQKRANDEFKKMAIKIIADIKNLDFIGIGKANTYCDTAEKLRWTEDGQADLVITSPPYLNGTNYCRNTKLELWISGILEGSKDLKKLRQESISCSINTAQKRDYEWFPWSSINRTIQAVEARAYDSRIAPMVANYFHDMWNVIDSLHRILKKGGSVYSVIGDSAFNNVHVPTQKHLKTIALGVGFSSVKEVYLRSRRSRGGMQLSEVVQIFKK